jgi:uncharacterized protein
MAKLVIALIVGAALAVAWIGIRNRHRFRYNPSPLSTAEFIGLATDGFAAEEVEVEPGVVLRGLVRVPSAGRTAWLVLFPGNGGSVLAGARKLGVDLAGDTGWGVAVWAYRGFDGSTGTPDVVAFEKDSAALWTRLQSKFGADPGRMHLVSFSLGTALALRIATLASERGTPPASLVLLAPYQRIGVTQNAWWAPWSLADRYDALAHARSSPTRALVVYGARDDAFPPGTAAGLAEALGPRARRLELAERGHTGWLDDAAVLSQVREFMREHTPT